ncbi:MAG: tetratricopeptide repeat protein, partial [Candidatus Binatia bacterium]
LADVLWFRTISYFGRHYRSDRLYPWLAGMCNAVTDLDPAAEHVYRFGGLILLWEADFTDAGIALLEKGTQNIPASWELQYMLGFGYYFFKDDLAAASRTLRAAALLPDAPEFVSSLAALTHAAREGTSRAIDFLTEVERNSTSDETRKVIHQRILELTLSRDIDALQAVAEAFAIRFGRRPMDLEEIVSAGMLASIPPEPFGGRYLYDPQTRRVQSSLGHQPRHLSSSRNREELLKRLGQEGDHGSRP